jgi:hypothetical protein
VGERSKFLICHARGERKLKSAVNPFLLRRDKVVAVLLFLIKTAKLNFLCVRGTGRERRRRRDVVGYEIPARKRGRERRAEGGKNRCISKGDNGLIILKDTSLLTRAPAAGDPHPPLSLSLSLSLSPSLSRSRSRSLFLSDVLSRCSRIKEKLRNF